MKETEIDDRTFSYTGALTYPTCASPLDKERKPNKPRAQHHQPTGNPAATAPKLHHSRSSVTRHSNLWVFLGFQGFLSAASTTWQNRCGKCGLRCGGSCGVEASSRGERV